MKLYTEEQVKEAMLKYAFGSTPTMVEVLNTLKPIELPSYEEIKKKSKDEYHYYEQIGFITGAEWMKEQILNQNK